MKRILTIFALIAALYIPTFAIAIETAPRISDREIVERLTRLEEGQKAILREIDKRFEAMDKRLDQMSLLQKYFINTTYSPFQKHFSSSYGLFDSKLQARTFNSVIFVFLNPFLNISIPCYLFIKKQF